MTIVYRDDFGREITYEEWLDLKYRPKYEYELSIFEGDQDEGDNDTSEPEED